MIGSTRETVSLEMSALIKAGRILWDGKNVTLPVTRDVLSFRRVYRRRSRIRRLNLHIEHIFFERIAEILAQSGPKKASGEIFPTVIVALRERLARTKRARCAGLVAEILRIGKECAALPVLDSRSADEILAYGADGLPH